MRKNGEYVGVDEKFIPENEKYVDESLLGDKEKAKKTAKKFAKGYLIFFVIFTIFAMSLPIFMYMKGIKDLNDFRNQASVVPKIASNAYTFSHLQGTQSGWELRNYLDDIITNNKLEAYTKITVVYNEISAITEDELLALKNELPDTSTDAYEVSVDYADSRGQAINKVTINDMIVE